MTIDVFGVRANVKILAVFLFALYMAVVFVANSFVVNSVVSDREKERRGFIEANVKEIGDFIEFAPFFVDTVRSKFVGRYGIFSANIVEAKADDESKVPTPGVIDIPIKDKYRLVIQYQDRDFVKQITEVFWIVVTIITAFLIIVFLFVYSFIEKYRKALDSFVEGIKAGAHKGKIESVDPPERVHIVEVDKVINELLAITRVVSEKFENCAKAHDRLEAQTKGLQTILLELAHDVRAPAFAIRASQDNAQRAINTGDVDAALLSLQRIAHNEARIRAQAENTVNLAKLQLIDHLDDLPVEEFADIYDFLIQVRLTETIKAQCEPSSRLGKVVRFELKVDDALHEKAISVRGTPFVESILGNILTNAFAFSARHNDQPRVLVSLSCRDGRIRATVDSFSPPFPPEVVERINNHSLSDEILSVNHQRKGKANRPESAGFGLILSKENALRIGGDLLLQQDSSQVILELPATISHSKHQPACDNIVNFFALESEAETAHLFLRRAFGRGGVVLKRVGLEGISKEEHTVIFGNRDVVAKNLKTIIESPGRFIYSSYAISDLLQVEKMVAATAGGAEGRITLSPVEKIPLLHDEKDDADISRDVKNGSSCAPVSILIVDDDRLTQDAILDVLDLFSERIKSVDLCTNCREAEQMLVSSPGKYDIVLVDQMIDDIRHPCRGDEFVMEIRARLADMNAAPTPKFIGMSAGDVWIKEDRFDAYIRKEFEVFKADIEKVIKNASRSKFSETGRPERSVSKPSRSRKEERTKRIARAISDDLMRLLDAGPSQELASHLHKVKQYVGMRKWAGISSSEISELQKMVMELEGWAKGERDMPQQRLEHIRKKLLDFSHHIISVAA